MKKFFKQKKGITLIALVITIIVLLILAGISIAMLSGDNGILQKATDAKQISERAETKEQAQMDIMAYIADKTANHQDASLDDEKVQEILSDNKTYVKEAKESSFITKKGEYEISYSELYHNENSGRKTINSIITEGDIEIKFAITGKNVNETVPPNPDSDIFEHVDGTTINSGYVIRDKSNGSGQGNEFVWVPVQADQRIELSVKCSEDIMSITLKDPYKQTMDLGIPGNIGTNYKNKNIMPSINGNYNLEVKTASKTETKTLVVRSLYALDAFGSYLFDGVQPNSTYSDTEDFSKSVNANGGFYIGRYEAGTSITNRKEKDINETVASIIATNGMPNSRANQKPYNYITKNQAIELAESMYPSDTHSFTCTLPTGAAWDRTIGWLINTENKTLNQTKASGEWGNYSNVSFNVETTALGTTDGINYSAVSNLNKPKSKMLLTTGASTSRNVSNNIFDLAGNVKEWSSLGKGTIARGGAYNENAPNYPSTDRTSYGDSNYANAYVGFRVALYL